MIRVAYFVLAAARLADEQIAAKVVDELWQGFHLLGQAERSLLVGSVRAKMYGQFAQQIVKPLPAICLTNAQPSQQSDGSLLVKPSCNSPKR